MDEVTRYLVRNAVIAPGDPVTLQDLEGGVSSDVVCVHTPGRSLVLKRALSQLKVAQPWYADLRRNDVEAHVMRRVSAWLPDYVPVVVWVDPKESLFAMEYVSGRVWKADLLNGRVDNAIADQLGLFLGCLHRRSYHERGGWAELEDTTLFYQLRIAPYFGALHDRYPQCVPALSALAQLLLESHWVLVHGDFSPKNVILSHESPIVLDWEVAHVGHPAFDAGFMLSHLFLKAIHAADPSPFVAAGAIFFRRYLEACEFDRVGMQSITFKVAGALMMARVDGKSPVEYLTLSQQRRARQVGEQLLLECLRDWGDLMRAVGKGGA